jgi:hypothetical protein
MDHAENTASLVKEVFLLVRCLPLDVLLLRMFAPAGMCLPSRCLAVGIHVTILWEKLYFVLFYIMLIGVISVDSSAVLTGMYLQF